MQEMKKNYIFFNNFLLKGVHTLPICIKVVCNNIFFIKKAVIQEKIIHILAFLIVNDE